MQNEIINIIGNIFLISFGLIIVILHKFMAHIAIVRWQKCLNTKPPNETACQIVYLIFGIAFIIFGLFNLLGG